jgi:hypothetical protein
MVAIVIILCTLLAGCSDIYFDRRESIAQSAGDAVYTDRVTQMVDPWPPQSGNRNLAFNGEKMQTAVERYRVNRAIPPVSAMTSSSGYQQAQQAAQALTAKP